MKKLVLYIRTFRDYLLPKKQHQVKKGEFYCLQYCTYSFFSQHLLETRNEKKKLFAPLLTWIQSQGQPPKSFQKKKPAFFTSCSSSKNVCTIFPRWRQMPWVPKTNIILQSMGILNLQVIRKPQFLFNRVGGFKKSLT